MGLRFRRKFIVSLASRHPLPVYTCYESPCGSYSQLKPIIMPKDTRSDVVRGPRDARRWADVVRGPRDARRWADVVRGTSHPLDRILEEMVDKEHEEMWRDYLARKAHRQ